MKLLLEDLDYLAIGATVLGSGGGGDPSADLLLVKDIFEESGPMEMVSVDQIPDEASIITAGYIGAPLVSAEKLSSYGEWKRAEELLNKKIWGVAPAEIGGSNALSAIIAASECGMRLIDADTLGRAFPYVHISSCALYGIGPTPAAIVDGMLQGVVIHCGTAQILELLARSVVTAMGSTAAGMLYPMTGRQAKKALLPGSISQAVDLGKSLSNSSLEQFVHSCGAKIVGRGVIVDIIQHIEEGFLKGEVVIQDGENRIFIDLQNEYLVVRSKDKILGTTPDIIVVIDSNSMKPIASDQVRYGLSVVVVMLPAPSIWKSEEGLLMTAPRAFGYNIEPVVIV